MATFLGAQAGAAFYDAFFYMGSDSIVNQPLVFRRSDNNFGF
jgi:hypothetical protein